MKSLDSQLRTVDPIEAEQQATGRNINDVSPEILKSIDPTRSQNIAMPRSFFEANEDIVVRKHHRFSTMFEHTHNFVELNYVYSGTCTQWINNTPITLPTKSLIMLDKKITQSIDYMGIDDILVNILLRDGASLNSVQSSISSSPNIVTKFMYNASKIESIHDNFIIFDLSHNEYAQNIIECLIFKGLKPDLSTNVTLRALYALLIPELVNCIENETINFDDTQDDLLAILRYIDIHFKDLTLNQLAKHFGYNANYLSNKLHNQTGESFQSLIDNKKHAVAAQLLRETDQSIEHIASLLGYNSTTSLYHLFKRIAGITPRTYRQNVKMHYNHTKNKQ